MDARQQEGLLAHDGRAKRLETELMRGISLRSRTRRERDSSEWPVVLTRC